MKRLKSLKESKICMKFSNDSRFLKEHESMHLGVRPFECNTWGKTSVPWKNMRKVTLKKFEKLLENHFIFKTNSKLQIDMK